MTRYVDADGNVVRRGADRPRERHVVTFGRAMTEHDVTAGGLYVNARVVRVNGRPVGVLYGTDPAPGNEHRPTAYLFAPDRGDRFTSERLESARRDIFNWWEGRRG